MRHPRFSVFIVAAGALLGVLSAPGVRAEDEGRIHLFGHTYSVLAGASAYVPRSTDTRSVYGSASVTPAVTIWSFDTPKGVGISWDLGARRLADGDRKAAFVQAGVGPRILFADNRSDVAPYLTVRGDAYGVRIDDGSWRAEPGANAELGASILRHVVVSGRYDLVRKVGGVDLSGFTARALVKVF